jgi:serine/threonine protein kinase
MTATPFVGRYRILRHVRTTALSVIRLAFDPNLGRRVILKEFLVDTEHPEPPLSHAEWKALFLREGRIMGRIDHPNVLPILETFSEPRSAAARDALRPFDPPDVRKRQERRPADEPALVHVMPPMACDLVRIVGNDDDFDENSENRARALRRDLAISAIAQTLSALAKLHEARIVHRDVKPGNILISSLDVGRARLCDFGMAKLGAERDLPERFWIGSRAYMAPEQYEDSGLAVPASDVNALGRLGMRILSGKPPSKTGELPWTDDDFKAIERPKLAEILKAALSERPSERPAAAEALRRILS